MSNLKLNNIRRQGLSLFILLLLAATALQLPRAIASPDTTIAITPVDNVANPGEAFSVNVTISGVGGNVTDVYGYQVKLGFDKAILKAKPPVVEGDYLKNYAIDNGYNLPAFTVKLDNPDYVYVVSSLVGAVAGCPYPDGLLFTVTFAVLAPGECPLDTFSSKVMSTAYQDPPGPPIAHTPPEIVESDGSFHTEAPVADFTFSPQTYGRPIVGENVTFDASTSYDPDGGLIVSYIWDFDDGTPLGSGMIVKHVYQTASPLNDPYNVTLTVVDDEGTNSTTYKGTLEARVHVKYHDIAISELTRTSLDDIAVHGKAEFNVTIVNNGSHADTLNLTTYYDSHPFNTTKIADLAAGESKNMTFVWNTFINQTTIIPSEKGAGAWTVDSSNASISDDIYSYSSTNQSAQDFRTYKSLDATGWESVSKVEVGLEVKTDAGGDDQLSIAVNTGLGWTEEHILNVTWTADSLIWIDVTGNLKWDPNLIQRNRVVVKLKYIQVGSTATPIYVDWLPVKVTPSNPRDVPVGSYALWATAFLVDPSTLQYRAGEEENTANNTLYGDPVIITVEATHEVEIMEFSVSPINVGVGASSYARGKVRNLGNVEEIIDVSVYRNSTLVASQRDLRILAGATQSFNPVSWYQATNSSVEGIYNVTVSITKIAGEGNFTNNERTVFAAIRLLPVASFTISNSSPALGDTVTFDASASYAPGLPEGQIKYYIWDFGEGSVNSTKIVTFVFDNAGSQTVKLTVIDELGLNSTASRSVQVKKLPSSITLSVSLSPVPISLNTTISGGITPNPGIVNVIINYTRAEEISWEMLANVTTASNGRYSFVWAPTSIGTYTLKAFWDGDSTIEEATSPLLNVAVKIQNVAVYDVVPAKYSAFIGQTVKIEVVAVNLGTATETFDVSVYYNETLLDTKNVSGLGAGTNRTLSFTLDTEDLDVGVCLIKAVAVTLPGETSTEDNTRTVGVFLRTEEEVEPTEGQGPDIFMYTTIALIVVVVALIAYMLLKMRKPKPSP